jgi:RNA-directed DNA polymerase
MDSGRGAKHTMRYGQRRATFERGRTGWWTWNIAKFFDHVNHDILMTRMGQTIRDKRVLRLIGRYLRAGAMLEGVVIRSEAGTPQGGPLSPLLANIYLHALDQELERRGLSFCRYADDCNV